MSNFDYKKYLAEGRIHLSEDEEQGTMSNIEVYTATFDNDFGTFIDDFASTVGVDNNVEMDQGRISTRPGDFNAWDEFGYEEHWNSIPDGSYFKIEGNTPGMVDYPSLKDYTFVRKGNVIKGELVTLKRDLAEGRIHLKEGKFGNVIQSLTQDISKAQDEGDSKMVSILKSYLPKLKTSEGDAEIESTLNALDTELAREFGESFDIVGSYLAEGKLLKEDLTITGEYEGKPVINSGDELEEYLIDIMSQAIGAKDFARKVAFGLTDETSSLSLEDQRKLIQFYLDNKQHFGSQGKSSPLPSSDYEKVVDGLRSRKIPSRVKLEEDGTINIELGFDFPDSLAGKVFDMLDELGVKADIMAETTAIGVESERIAGGPRRDYRREDRDDGDGQDEEWYSESVNEITLKENENAVIDSHWVAYVQSLVNDIRINGVGDYASMSDDDVLEDFEFYIQDRV
jgi:hypothetical protein